MFDLSTAPRKIRALLLMCLVGTVVSLGITFWVYSSIRDVAQSVGKDTVPQIVAAKNIRATLANAHSNAMNAMLTKEKLGGKFWNLYREDLNSLHSQLIDASKHITYGDEERIPLFTILSNISAYEYTVGGAVSSGAEISVDQFMEANRLMQQKILPASSALNHANLSQLDSIYASFTKNINNVMFFMRLLGIAFLIILIGTQVYLFKKTHRILNIGLLIATILFSVNFVYSASALNSVKSDLYTAKHDAFDSLNALLSAKAEAYNANAIESLYLLHNGTGIVQTADTINFNLSAARLNSDPKAALAGGKFEGYLNDALSNVTFSGEKEAVGVALQQWAKYVDIDKQIRSLEYDSKHNDAIALCVGYAAGQSNFEFAKFDSALGDTININQINFDSSINSAFKTLNMFPYITAVFLVLISTASILGMKARIDEYKI
jgi:hypothetical protein